MSRQLKTLTRSFAGGEMSPEMFGRMDDIQFQAGADTLLNMIPRPTGSAARRSGTELVREAKDSTSAPHLFPFVFSQNDSLVIEAGRATVGGIDSGYFRIHTHGGTLLYSAPKEEFAPSVQAFPNGFRDVVCTATSPGVVYALSGVGHGLSVDDNVIFIGGLQPGGTDRDWYQVNTVESAYAFTLKRSNVAVEFTGTGFEVSMGGPPGFFAPVGGYDNNRRWATSRNEGWNSFPGHDLKGGDAVHVTMVPYSTSKVRFAGSYFWDDGSTVSGISRDPDPAFLGQQVIFQPNAAYVNGLPPNVVAGKPYYIIHNTGFENGMNRWRISESRGGQPFATGADWAASNQSGSPPIYGGGVAAMPNAVTWYEPNLGYGSAVVHGSYDINRVYYVVKDPTSASSAATGMRLTSVKLAATPGEAEDPSAGISWFSNGTGERRIQKVQSASDISWFRGKAYYCRRTLTDLNEVSGAQDHDINIVVSNSNTRVPGIRTKRREADYWRELSGKSTGASFQVTVVRDSTAGQLRVDAVGHGLSDGQCISFVQGAADVGSTAYEPTDLWYVDNKQADNFRVEPSIGGTNATLSTTFQSCCPRVQAWPTWDVATDKVGWPDHGLLDGDPVVFSLPLQPLNTTLTSTLPGGLSHDTTYYVVNKTDHEFQVSASKRGSAIDLTGSPTNFHVVNGGAFFEIPHDYSDEELPDISTTQSNDVMTLASDLRPAAELIRSGTEEWSLEDIDFKSAAKPPTSLIVGELHEGESFKVYGIKIDRAGDTAGPPDPANGYGAPDPVNDIRPLIALSFNADFAAELGDGYGQDMPEIGAGSYIYLTGSDIAFNITYGNLTTNFTKPGFTIPSGYYKVVESHSSVALFNRITICNTDGSGFSEEQLPLTQRDYADIFGYANTSAVSSHATFTGTNADKGEPTYTLSGNLSQAFWYASPTTKCRLSSLNDELEQEYVVTSIDINNEESPASESLVVENNLYVSGAFTTISWNGSPGAERYRVYKKLSGLYGFIGETDENEFKDDNIGPDMSVTPPITDASMRKKHSSSYHSGSEQLFYAGGNYVRWPNHGITNGAPVVFSTTDRMPGVEEGKTYYVINKSDDTFQITATEGSSVIVDMTGDSVGRHTAISGSFPGATTYHEGRRIFGGSKAFPQDIYMSASGTEADMSYSIPTVDSDRIYFRIAAREQSRVRHILPLARLLVLTDSTEYQVTPANDDILTPSSVSVRPQSFIGAGAATPALVNNTTVFAAARGGHVRELGYSSAVLGYLTGDLSIRAAHLFDGYTIKDMAYSKAPIPIVWCVSSSGKLLGVTYVPEEKVSAWFQCTTTNGTFESVVSVPEGDEDAVYVAVKRGDKRYIERLASIYRGGTENLSNAFFVDSGVTYEGPFTTTITALSHLEGMPVAYLADGLPGTGTVSGGTLTLPELAQKVSVGLPFTSQIKTLPMTMLNVDAFGTGRTKNITRVWARLFESGAFQAGPDTAHLRSSLKPASRTLLTDFVEVTMPSSWNDEGQIIIQQSDPLPLTIAGMTIEVASGG